MQLVCHGYSVIREILQLEWSYCLVVLQVETNYGLVYFRWGPLFVNEGFDYQKLIELMVEHLETPMAADVTARLLLL